MLTTGRLGSPTWRFLFTTGAFLCPTGRYIEAPGAFGRATAGLGGSPGRFAGTTGRFIRPTGAFGGATGRVFCPQIALIDADFSPAAAIRGGLRNLWTGFAWPCRESSNSLRDRIRLQWYWRDMTITAKVHNHRIELPPDFVVREGAEVRVTLPDEATVEEQPTSLFDSLKDIIGKAEGLPDDFAAEHDHYIHGTPKRSGQ